jgi:hypothetical protein
MSDDDLAVYSDDLSDLTGKFLPKRRRSLSALLENAADSASVDAGKATRRIPTEVEQALTDHAWRAQVIDAALSNEVTELARLIEDVCSSEPVNPAEALSLRAELHARSNSTFEEVYDSTANRRSAAAARKELSRSFIAVLDNAMRASDESANSRNASQSTNARRTWYSTIVSAIFLGFLELDIPLPTALGLMVRAEPATLALAFVAVDDLEVVRNAVKQCALLPPADRPRVEWLLHLMHLYALTSPNLSRGCVDEDPGTLLPQFARSMPNLSLGRVELGLARSGDTSGTIVRLWLAVPKSEDEVSSLKSDAIAQATPVVFAYFGMADEAQASSQLSDSVSLIALSDDVEDSSKELEHFLLQADARQRVDQTSVPLTYNFARAFPLDKGMVDAKHRVTRSSVQELLRDFKKRNGVRLWCSVRRSGKTTACNDLLGLSDDYVALAESCSSSGTLGHTFMTSVKAALVARQPIADSFFEDCVGRMMTGNASSDQGAIARRVFILDEYETLFQLLAECSRTDELVRLTVVVPLLDQLTSFSRDNLLVLLGQQPSAHQIMMDINPLSPLVHQDAYPLFQHHPDSGGASEFSMLMDRILGSSARAEPSFVDAIYNETQGHPWLTVSLMVELVEWLIACEKPSNPLILSRLDAEQFAIARLGADHISGTATYGFFLEAIAQATSQLGRGQNEWLYSVYTAMRAVCDASPEHMRCTRAEFDHICSTNGPGKYFATPPSLLLMAKQANFLSFDEEFVWPTIRLLGRLAKATSPNPNV